MVIAGIATFLFMKPTVDAVPKKLANVASVRSDITVLPVRHKYPRLKVPSINVDANIIDVGLTSGGAMDVPKFAKDVGLYTSGVYPGQKGSAVIAGHVSSRDGSDAAFQNLYKLRSGDKIYIEKDNGTAIKFVVQKSQVYGINDRPNEVFNKKDGTYLNLITCNGQWDRLRQTYNKRLVVFTAIE